jgi:hypothetical protein
MSKPLLVIVDADTLAGWRRVTASLAQLHDAVRDLRAQEPEATIAVIADASLKWALSEVERDEIEEDIRLRFLLFAPAGCQGGHRGFIARVAEQARRKGFEPVAVTDQLVADCPVARVRRDGSTWVFDIENASAPTVVAAGAGEGGGGHRRRGSAKRR